MKILKTLIVLYILFSPLFFAGSLKFLHYFLFFSTSILIFLYLIKNEISISFKLPLALFFIFSFLVILTSIPVSNFIIKFFSPNLHKIINSFEMQKAFSLSLAPVWTLRNLSYIITAVSIFFVSFLIFEKKVEKTYKFSRILFFTIFSFTLYSLFLKFSNFSRYPFPPFKPNEWNFGLFPNANIFASYALFGIPLGFFLFIYKLKQKNSTPGSAIFYLLGTIFLISALFLAQSWGAIFSLLLSANICLFFRKPFLGLIFFIILIFLIYFIFQTIPPDIKRSMENRFSFYLLGFEIFTKFPLTGSGLGTIPIASGIYQKPLFDTIVDKIHNDYIELLSTSGLLSLLLFLSIGIVIYKNMAFLKEKYNLRCGILLSIICILIHSLVDFPLQNFTILSYFSFSLGFLYINHKTEEKKSKTLKYILLSLLSIGIIFQFFLVYGLINIKQKGYSYMFPEESFEEIRNNPQISEKFLNYFPFYAPIWGEVSRLKEKEEKFEDAIDAIEKAIILNPTNPKLYPLAAKLYFIKGDDEKYLTYLSYAFGLSKTLSLNPFPLNEIEKEKVILESLKISDKYYGKNAEHFYLKSYYALLNIKSKKAKDVLKEGVEKIKESSEIHYLLSNEYLKEGNLKLAEEENNKSFSIKKDIKNKLLYAKIYFKNDNYEKGKNYLYEGLELITPDLNTLSYFVEGALLMKPKSIDDAKEFLKTGYFIRPYPLIAYYIGYFEENEKNYIFAEEWYKKSIELDDKFENSYQGLYRIYKAQNDLKNLDNLKNTLKLKFPEKKWYEE